LFRFSAVFVSYLWICGGGAEELASGKDAKEKAWLADVSIQGLGPFQAAARLGRVDVCRCMVEELGFDINAGSKIGKCVLKIESMSVLMSSILQCCHLHNLSIYVYSSVQHCYHPTSAFVLFLDSGLWTCGHLTSHLPCLFIVEVRILVAEAVDCIDEA
jgi:hypothetical protein